MNTATLVLVAILVLVLLVVILGWRILARRVAVPCPPGLIALLENRIMEDVAGSRAIIERAGVEKGMVVLDAGCGPGRVTIPLARQVGPEGRVVALDLQPGMLAILGERLAQQGITNVTPMQAGLGQGRLKAEGFDRAVMVTVLGEIPDRIAALREIYHALRPGGLLSVTEVLPDPHFQPRGTVRKLARDVGFQVEQPYSSWRAFTLNLSRPRDA